jgi:hypothetical protein
MNNLYSKIRGAVYRSPIVSGLAAAVLGFTLMNLSSAAWISTLPSLLYLLPCLLMLAMCMKHQSGGKCGKDEKTVEPNNQLVHINKAGER